MTADDAQNALQLVDVSDIEVFNPWMSIDQINHHFYFQTTLVSRFCYGVDPLSRLRWFRGGAYTAGDNPVTSYSNGQLKAATVSQLITDPQGLYMRVRFRAPTTPQYPCPGCAFDDSEDLRYWSLSFQTQGTTFASLSDDKLTKDSQGYVTLIVNLNPNSPRPAQVTAENGYTYLDLSAAPAIETLSALALRQMLPSGSYERCAASQIPYSTTEYNDQGGLMGEYVPAVDFRTAKQLPAIADHVDQGDTCSLQPTTTAQPCSSAP